VQGQLFELKTRSADARPFGPTIASFARILFADVAGFPSTERRA